MSDSARIVARMGATEHEKQVNRMTLVGPCDTEAQARTWHDEVGTGDSQYANMKHWWVAPLNNPR